MFYLWKYKIKLKFDDTYNTKNKNVSSAGIFG